MLERKRHNKSMWEPPTVTSWLNDVIKFISTRFLLMHLNQMIQVNVCHGVMICSLTCDNRVCQLLDAFVCKSVPSTSTQSCMLIILDNSKVWRGQTNTKINMDAVVTFWQDHAHFQNWHQVVYVAVDALCHSRVLRGGIREIRNQCRWRKTGACCRGARMDTWIFMAISLPSFNTAWCTWPMDAAANGLSS